MLRFAEFTSEPRSVELILREWLETADARDRSATKPTPPQQSLREWEDQLSLLARWFYGKPRVGEIFIREGTPGSLAGGPQGAVAAPTPSGRARRNSEWPYRRILRACSRLLAPPEDPGGIRPAPPKS